MFEEVNTGQKTALPGVRGHTDLVAFLEGWLDEQLQYRCPYLQDAAQDFDISVRTLQRRLSAEGSNWSGLVGAARFRKATGLLANGRASITDIALELGYAETSSFSRAFQRSAGVSPKQFRISLH